MSKSLKEKTYHGICWGFVEGIGGRLIQLIIGIMLARLLVPEQFGLIGMLTIFLAVAQTFLDSGFGAALIQRPVITEKDTSSIFFFNILVGVVAAACLCVAAPWVSKFYSQPILTLLLRVMSLLLVINAFGLVQTVLLTKAIDFMTQAKVTLIASVLSGAIGIGMAYHGYGVWSLVCQQLAAATFRVALLWSFNKWRPAWLFSLDSLREMFGFGSRLLALGLLNTIFENIYLIVIGKIYSPADLGHFTRANQLQKLPSETLSGMIARVSFPVFSSIQQDRERVKRGMKRALTTLVLINFPLMIGLAVVARPLVIVLLTEKWLPCVPYLQLLCLVGLVFPLHLINLNVLLAFGRSNLLLKLEIMKKGLVVLNILITWQWGITAMITGQVIISLVSYYLNAYYNNALLDYSIWEQIGDLYPYLINAVLMGGVVRALAYLPVASHMLLLIYQTMAGMLIYLLLCRLFHCAAYMDLQKMVLHRIPFHSTPKKERPVHDSTPG